ncbi:type 2 periplasmic-binding domain-containing protein [Alginatibacterium sediminis]|uniref:amino acid ABC transporter substrate-binding protein n=1 Tax=Alginatibacterium sediminis TaxID=2164068 RepID=UPI0011C44891|nr:amino acid ABC transporter substrate-binding protein [Alginatibacterium sediminis]
MFNIDLISLAINQKLFGFRNLLLLVLYLATSGTSFAMDEIRFESGQSDVDSRMSYKREVLTTAMEKTVSNYGSYRFSDTAPRMNTLRALNEMVEGKQLNVFIALTNQSWENKTIPIRIPVRRGILSYRLLLINKEDVELFRGVKTVADLKNIPVGLRQSWTITRVMETLGFDVVTTSDYESIFSMLNRKRFGFSPRGVHEIYDEFEERIQTLPNLAVESTLALYIPAPSYVFVSPQYPRLAKRLADGLEKMVNDGSLQAIFEDHFGEHIKRADLKNRTIIKMDNPLLPLATPIQRQELWWSPAN